MALLIWSREYSVGVETMDLQHKVLFGMLNELHEAMLNGRGRGIARPMLGRLMEYTREHFAAEETEMTLAQYPALEEHRVEHHALTRKVQEYMSLLEDGEAAINLHLLNFLREWLSRHIQQTDKEYGPWLSGRAEAMRGRSAA